MRRLLFILAAFYFVLIGGSYYYNVFAIRVFHHAFVTVVLLIWILSSIRRGRGFLRTPFNLWLFASVILWFIAALQALDPRISLESVWFPLTHLIMFFVLVDLVQSGRTRLIVETQFLIAAVVVLIAGMQLIAWYIGWAEVGLWIPSSLPRIYSPFGVSTWLSAYVAPLVLITGVWALTTPRRDFRVVLILLSASLMVILLATGSRGGLLSLATAVGIFLMLRFLNNRGSNLQGVLILGGVGIITVVMIALGSLESGRATGDVLRADLWRCAVNMGLEHPLFGVGPGQFGREYRTCRTPVEVDDRLGTAHNVYLNTFAETGMVGMAISLGLGITIVLVWWRRWRSEPSATLKIRSGVTFAALVGLGVQSAFDTFVMTPLVLLILVLLVLSVIPPRSRLDPPPAGNRLMAAIVALLLIVYGVGFVQSDRAQSHFYRSQNGSLEEAQEAAAIDPSLRLYQLQIAYLTAQDPTVDLNTAIHAYENALLLEPTWETGWMNLAALYERNGQISEALAALDRTNIIRDTSGAYIQWARIAEANGLETEADILYAYDYQMYGVPLSNFWTQTPLRREAVEHYISEASPSIQYRYYAVVDSERARTLVPTSTPVDAEAWWIKGEYALTVEDNPQAALEAFDQAVRLSPRIGDYYLARARALAQIDRERAQRDLKIGLFLGASAENPSLVALALAQTPDEVRAARLRFLSGRIIYQNFEGVLFQGRTGNFDLFPEMQSPGMGETELQPVYDLARDYMESGDTDRARMVYRAILDVAPYAQLAREQLALIDGT